MFMPLFCYLLVCTTGPGQWSDGQVGLFGHLTTQTSPKRPWSVVSWSGGPFRASDHPNFSQKALVIRLGDAFREGFGPGRHSARALGPRGHSVRLWGCVSWCFMAQGCILCGLGERVNGPSRLHNHCCKILIVHGIFYFSVWFGPRECNSMQLNAT